MEMEDRRGRRMGALVPTILEGSAVRLPERTSKIKTLGRRGSSMSFAP
jgi:hypothetical protein